MEANKRLIITVGLPRSGKSTYAKDSGYPIVNPDSVRLALHGNAFISDAETMVWAIAKYMVKSLFLSGHSTVILDATNTTKARRSEWISKMWDRQFVLFATSKDECISRALSTEKPELIPVIERMESGYEPLQLDEMSDAERQIWTGEYS